jgi:hypothetical protein
MASWKKITEDDGSSVQINMDNVTHMKRGKGDQITTILFVSGAGNEIYVIARETPEQILLAQPLMVL